MVLTTLSLMIVASLQQQHSLYRPVRCALATNQLYATLNDEQKQEVRARFVHPPASQATLSMGGIVIAPLVATLLNAVSMLTANAPVRGTADAKLLLSDR
jgi:hypothetical protein